MNATEKQLLDVIAKNTEAVTLLQQSLLRDPAKEFLYGDFSPRFNSRDVALRCDAYTLNPTSNVVVACTQINVQAILINYCFTGTGNAGAGLIVQLDNDPTFPKSRIAAGEANMPMFSPTAVAINDFDPSTGTSSQFNYFWNLHLPVSYKCVRMYVINLLPNTPATNSRIQSVAFLGK